jgi:hypothetical protein
MSRILAKDTAAAAERAPETGVEAAGWIHRIRDLGGGGNLSDPPGSVRRTGGPADRPFPDRSPGRGEIGSD